MPLQKYIFNPGINKEGTDYSAEGGWFDSNLVRFRKGLPEKIGGWQKYIETSYEGTGRKLHGWVDLDGTKLLGLGTRFKLYIQEGTSYNDITPIRATTSAGDVTFGATDGSNTLTVTDSGHGAVDGDFVTFSGAASLGGNITAAVLNQEYQVVSVPTANTFTIVAKDTDGATVTANSSDSGNGGGSVVGVYQINSGLDVFVDGTGWSVGAWGSGTWGSTTSLGDSNQLRLWSMDNFGEDLISNPRAGSIYYWDKTNGLNTRAVPLTSLAGANKAPTKGLQVLVSDVDRHVIVLGADPISGGSRSGTIDPLLVAFSDQENAAEWEPLATNTAGSLRCSAGSEIIGGLRARQETLIWTDVALYSLQFIGQAFQVFGFVNKQFDEVGWFYCSGENTVIDKYVAYNYVENSWTIGELSRTAWLDEGLVSFPRAAGKSSDTPYLYSHETGFDDDGSPMNNVFIESADFDIGDGQEFQFIRRFIPDVKFTGNSSGTQKINLVLKARNFPGQTLTTDQTSSFTATTTKVDTRARGRQAAVRFESDDDAETVDRLGVGFRIGATRLDVQPNGRR